MNSARLLRSKVLEWGAVVLLAFFVVGAAKAYFSLDVTWLHWSGYAFIAWMLAWTVLTKIKTFRESRQHGGVGEGAWRVLPKGVIWRFAASAMIVLLAFVSVQYLPGTPWASLFSAILIMYWLGLLVWAMLRGFSELRRERRITSGVLLAAVSLILLSSAPYLIRVIFGKVH